MQTEKIIENAITSKAWPFKEAEKILQKLGNKIPKKGYVLFETGYGPSGLPHIGTFGEVVRTVMVKKAFELMSDIPTKLICFSDDMDGMREIPDTIPNKEDYEQYLDLPLTAIPDPFGTNDNYGDHMNTRMKKFLDSYDFEYEFYSATECYKNGMFNDTIIAVLDNYEKIMDIMLPTLGEERQKTYSPFMPICPETGKVLQVPVTSIDKENKTITYTNLSGKEVTTKVTDGACKLQWKPDFGMRWAALDVDFEMYGKDHLVNGVLYSKICNTVGGVAPYQMFYELFLDSEGKKISKSKGNGISIEDWLRYAPQESLALFMYQSPQKAKKLYFDVIPKNVDEYITFLNKYAAEEDPVKKFANPVYHIHSGNPPEPESNVTFSLLLNLVGACNSDDINIIWGYINRFDAKVTPENAPFMNKMVQCATNYYEDFVKPNKKYRLPTDVENSALKELVLQLSELPKNTEASDIQSIVYAIGKQFEFELRDWFKALYEILLGASQGPRFGSFVALYGINETIQLIQSKLQ